MIMPEYGMTFAGAGKNRQVRVKTIHNGNDSRITRILYRKGKDVYTLFNAQEYSVVRLSKENVAKTAKEAKAEGKEEGERLFSESYRVLKSNFKMGSKRATRSYFFCRNEKNWYVQSVLDEKKKVLAATMWNYDVKHNVMLSSLTAVDREARRCGASTAMVEARLAMANDRAKRLGRKSIDCIICEVEQPDMDKTGKAGRLMNVIRPQYHDKVSKMRCILLKNDQALTIVIPGLWKGHVLPKVYDYLFTMRPIKTKEETGVNARKLARLLHMYYMGYIRYEYCWSGLPDDFHAGLLAKVLNKLPVKERITPKMVLDEGEAVARFVEKTQLPFVPMTDPRCRKQQ